MTSAEDSRRLIALDQRRREATARLGPALAKVPSYVRSQLSREAFVRSLVDAYKQELAKNLASPDSIPPNARDYCVTEYSLMEVTHNLMEQICDRMAGPGLYEYADSSDVFFEVFEMLWTALTKEGLSITNNSGES